MEKMDFKLDPLSSKMSNMEDVSCKLLILGSGPAGLSAALYAARAEMQPIVIAGNELGGQAALTFSIENYPGFPEGIGGMALGEAFQKQAERFGAIIKLETAKKVDFFVRPFKIETSSTNYYADTVIIATGASPNLLGVPGEKEFTGKGISYCATCDGWFYREKDVFVVGGGDSALEEAIFLTRYANNVTIIHRRDKLRAGQILQERARANPKISFIWESLITEIKGTENVKSALIMNSKTGQVVEKLINGIFIFIGHKPNVELFKEQISLDEKGYIRIDNLYHTNIEGVFAAGEVADSHFRQVITSAGMGAAAAIQATRFLESKG